MSATSSISGAQRHAFRAERTNRPLSTPSPASASSTPYARAIAYACAVSALPILFQPPNAIFSAEAEPTPPSSGFGLTSPSGNRAATACDVLRIARQVQIHVSARDDRAVDAAQVAGDPLHALGRDRVPFDVDPVEALGRDLAGHVLGDRRRAEADHELALGDELANGPDVAKRRGALSGRRAPSFARPEHLAGHRRSDERAHLAWKEKSHARHGAIFADPGARFVSPKVSNPPTEGWEKGARGAMRNSSRQSGSPLTRCAPIAAISVSSSPPSPRERSCSPRRRRAR